MVPDGDLVHGERRTHEPGGRVPGQFTGARGALGLEDWDFLLVEHKASKGAPTPFAGLLNVGGDGGGVFLGLDVHGRYGARDAALSVSFGALAAPRLYASSFRAAVERFIATGDLYG